MWLRPIIILISHKPMAPSISQRLLKAEEEFLEAITAGDSAVDAFEESWKVLGRDIQQAVEAETLSDETKKLAHDVGSRISIMANAMLDIETRAEGIRAQLTADCDAILAQAQAEVSIVSPGSIPDSHPR